MKTSRVLLSVGAAMAIVVAVPTAAMAGIDPPGACDGAATIEGAVYTPANDTTDNPVVVPADRDGIIIPYTGMVIFENKGHSGKIYLDTPITQVFGETTGRIPVASWSHSNEGDERATTGTYSLDQFWEDLGFRITGLLRMSGKHNASGGSCSGFVFVKFTGNPLGTPIGIVAVVGGVITGAIVIWAGVPRRGR
ncbi:MAG: hypothetical protein ACE5MI_12125 [Acidimicrobiia bacterium]